MSETISQPLPAAPSLEQLRNQAKSLLKAHRERDADAAQRIAQHLPRLSDAVPAQVFDSKFLLSEAQLVVAREHGFSSWPRLKKHVESLNAANDATDSLEDFKAAVRDDDAVRVKTLLRRHPALKKHLDEPLFSFDSPALVFRGANRKMVEALLDAGADINARSQWWAGSYGLLEGAAPEMAPYLIARGATVTIHAAAHLGMMDTLSELLDADPALVNARAGDGQGPLHYASAPEGMDLLLQRGADLELRDIDHNSTAAQHAVTTPDKCRHLLLRGAQPDIFMAIMLGDIDLTKTILRAEPESVRARVNQGQFTSGESDGGHIYSYLLPADRPLHLAAHLGHHQIVALLLQRSTPHERFLFACWQGDDKTVDSALAQQPDLVRSLPPEDANLVRDAAREGKADAVRVMLRAGFSVGVPDGGPTPLHEAALRGHLDVMKVLVENGADAGLIDGHYHSTPAGWANHNGQAAARDYLLEHCPNITDAAGFGQTERVAAILDENPTLLNGQPDGARPLHWAVWGGHDETIRLLLARGADPNLKTPDGRTALDVALENKREEIAQLVRERGAKTAQEM